MWSLRSASPENSFVLAKEIEASGKWTSFLTPQEHQLFQAALNHNMKTWDLFLKGKLPCQLRFESVDEEPEVVTDINPITLAFRVRYMLWESHIDTINGHMHSSGDQTHTLNEPSKPATKEQTKPHNVTSKADSDDDYDDDEGDEDKNEDEISSSEEPLTVVIVNTKSEDSEPDARGRFNAVSNSSKMYDTFESDVEKMRRFQRLKDSDEQIQRDSGDGSLPLSAEITNGSSSSNEVNGSSSPSLGSSITAFAKTAQFGSANLCLKHLLTAIEMRRSELPVTDIELRNLVSDVRKNRSKWASEERIGQEELYEACERVVQELRGTTEHSTAFLNKVSKREAPNYNDVIKTPMDLNTVMRKLRALQYNSKKEFIDDLNLIWSNCLTYNSDPSHFLRAHAVAMHKKTQALAPLIPDVAIRSRAEVEAEAELLEQQAQEQRKRRGSESNIGQGSKRKVGVTPMKFKGTESSRTKDSPADTADTNIPDALPSPNDNQKPSGTPSIRAEEGVPSDTKVEEAEQHKSPDAGAMTPTDAMSVDQVTDAEAEDAAEPIDEEEFLVPDVESSFWNSATRRRRIQCISGRQQLFKNDKLQMDAVAVSGRTPGTMLRFDKTIRGEDMSGQIAGLSLLSNDPGEEPFMIEYEVHAGVPPAPPGDSSAWISAPIPKLEELPPSKYMSQGVLNDLVFKNLNEMQIIRRLCAKILYIKDLQSGQIPAQHETGPGGGGPVGSASDYPNISEPEEDISSRLPGATPFDSRASSSAMRRSVAIVAMQAGFEAAQPRAVNTLAAIAGDYLVKLGATLVANLEAHNSTASFGSIMTGSLEQMGLTRLSQLTKYISDDVLRQGRRLSTFRSRLNNMLIEILRPEVDKYRDEQFQDNSEQFVLGEFSNELGDDYFGFKDLGINDELGMSSIAVPFHLLQQRVAYQDSGITQSGDGRKVGLDVPEYPPLFPKDIEALPAPLKPAFEKLLLKHHSTDTRPAEEAEQLNRDYIIQSASQAASLRAKVPTSGKLVPRKKRFDCAHIVEKTELSYPSPKEETTDLPEASRQYSEAQDNHNSAVTQDTGGQDMDASDPDAENDLNNEIGSLAFDTDPAPTNGFAFDDSLPTGSLLLQADDEEEDEVGDTGDASAFDFIKE